MASDNSDTKVVEYGNYAHSITDTDPTASPLLVRVPKTVSAKPTHITLNDSGQDTQDKTKEKTWPSLVDDPARTPRSEFPSSTHTRSVSWISEGVQPQSQAAEDHDSYFTSNFLQNISNATFIRTVSTSTLSSISTGSFQDGQSDSMSASGSPDGRPHVTRDHSNQTVTGASTIPQATSSTPPASHIQGTAQRRRDNPDYPKYPNQSFSALQSQHYPSSYRPPTLRTRSSHPSQGSFYALGAPKKPRDHTMTSGAKTVGNTPAQSPGLFSPTSSSQKLVAEDSDDAHHGTPLLHPTHLQAPKETHKLLKDIDPISGRKLVNNYEFINKLGSGGHGTVKLGRDLQTGDLVAIKIVRRFSKKVRLGKSGDPYDMIKKEVAILKKARHPHVVSLLEVIDDQEYGKVYLVLEFIEKGEIVWRKKTDKDIAIFEMNRVKREMAGQINDDLENAETERFNSTVKTRREDKTRVLDDQRRQAQDRLMISKCDNGKPHEPETASDAFWSLEYGGEPEDDQTKGSSDTPRTDTQGVDITPATDVTNSRQVSPQSSSPVHLGSKAPDAPGSRECHSATIGEDPNSRVASMFNLEGTMWGAYTSDERTPEVALETTLEQIINEQTQWTDEEEEYRYVPCLTLSQALDAFRDTVLGLEYLHYQGIIHRDIKPANLLWTADHRVKISDFGVSYLGKPIREDDNHEEIPEADSANHDEALELAKTVGTPLFYAPELCDPDLFDVEKNPERPQITGQIDVWALGVTLYCMIFGRLPFVDVNEFAMYEKIARQEVFIPRMRLKGVEDTARVSMNCNKRVDDIIEYEEVDDDLRDLLKRLFHKKPSARISLKEVKHHPWVLRGIQDRVAWLDETDPLLQSQGKKIEVSTKEVQEAVVGLTIVDRIKSGIRRLGSVVRGRDSRKRAESNAKGVVGPGSVSTSMDGTHAKEGRRSSLRGDEQIFTALRASREGSEHPLAQSVTASPEIKEDPSYSFFDGNIFMNNAMVLSASVANSPHVQQRPSPPEREVSVAESMKTIRAHVPAMVPEGRTPTVKGLSSMTSEPIDTGSPSALGGIFGGAGRRFVKSMRSRERGRGRDSAPHSRRSSWIEPPISSIEDPHASPSIAFSTAVASGHVDLPPVLRDLSSSAESPPSTAFFYPHLQGEYSTEAFQRAEEQNRRRHLLENERAAENADRASASSAGSCPPSPDDMIFYPQQNYVPAPDDVQLLGVSSSDEQMASGISESFSHPSIPSVVSGASSLSTATEDFALQKPVPLRVEQPVSRASTASTIEVAKGMHPGVPDDDEAGYNGDGDVGEDGEESEDEGIIFGGK